MKFFRIKTQGDLSNEALCVLHGNPKPLGAGYVCLVEGHTIAGQDIDEVTMEMSNEVKGVELASFIGNTTKFLIVSRDVQRVVQRHDGDNTEYLPFTLLDQRKRVCSRDYVFVNPLTILDALHRDESDLMFFKDTGRIIKVRKIVLNRLAVANAPGIFKIEHDRKKYIINEQLAQELQAQSFTNLFLEELEVA